MCKQFSPSNGSILVRKLACDKQKNSCLLKIKLCNTQMRPHRKTVEICLQFSTVCGYLNLAMKVLRQFSTFQNYLIF